VRDVLQIVDPARLVELARALGLPEAVSSPWLLTVEMRKHGIEARRLLVLLSDEELVRLLRANKLIGLAEPAPVPLDREATIARLTEAMDYS
jgi:hypothetical protein